MNNKPTYLCFLQALIITILFSCSPDSRQKKAIIDDQRLVNADQSSSEWLSYGKNYFEDRHSSLNQINKSTINNLGLAWSINLGTRRGLEATPLVVNGIMYFTGTWSTVYAVDVRQGKIIWTYDPKVPREWGEKVCCDVVNRGVAIYKGMVFSGTLDGRLLAINASTGVKVWEVTTVDQSKPYSITGAPRVVKGNVIIGNGGAEYGVRGYITAYDAMTGQESWRFYTVPGDPGKPFESAAMQVASQTWTGEWWKFGGGGTCWDAMAFDPELNLLYVGTGNGSPWNRDLRSPDGGDNLYLSSIVALNPDTGKLEWYYQTTPGETWDYTATQPIILADIQIDGVERQVLMQAPKNGFFYVIDRTNGEFISAKPFVYTNWAKEIDQSTGRPIETEFARYANTRSRIAPGPWGGHNWQAMAFNKKTGLVYIPAIERNLVYGQPRKWEFVEDPRTWNLGIGGNDKHAFHEDTMARNNHGKLIAWNPVEQKEVWSVWQKFSWNAGVLATDELVFQGNGEGTFAAYDAYTGKKVWSYELNTGIIAPPITYSADGKQYISILVGWGGTSGMGKKYTNQINPGTLYTFCLGGTAQLPEFDPPLKPALINIDFSATEEQIATGRALFYKYCSRCHKWNGGGSIPDLMYSSADRINQFQAIVRKGALLPLGMPNFGDRLSETDADHIKYFILSRAKMEIDRTN